MGDLALRATRFGAIRRYLGACPGTVCLALCLIAGILFAAGGAMAQEPSAAARAQATEALFDAVQRNDLAAVQASIAAGADMSAINDWEVTPIDLAVDKGYFQIAHFLLSLRGFRESNAQPEQPAPEPVDQGAPEPAPTIPVVRLSQPAVVPPAPPSSPPPAWPADKPNPFDPNTRPAGSNLPITGEVRGPGGKIQPAPKTAAWPEAPQRSQTAARPAPVPAAGQINIPAQSTPVVRSAAQLRALTAPTKELARVPVPAPRKPAPLTEGVLAPTGDLRQARLALGESLGLGRPTGGPPTGAEPGKVCVNKDGGAFIVCVEDVNWPAELRGHVTVKQSMYKDTRAAVRYDRGRITRLHALFPSGSFDGLVAYYTRRYGAPAKVVGTGPATDGRRVTPRAIWQAIEPGTDQVVSLDIRKFDDVRSSFPDTQYGAIMIYPAESPPVFPRMPLLKIKLHLMKGR